MTRPLVSIIIPTLNEEAHLPVLLAGLRKQLDTSFEIIVGDGGSADETRLIAAEGGAEFISARRGRGAQMNAAVKRASGTYLLFLHADSSLDDPYLISNAVKALELTTQSGVKAAGHFRLRFIRNFQHNNMAYRYAEEKSALNRANTTNGDQGFLVTRDFFNHLGGFDERLPFLEDQRFAEKVRSHGKWITLPGYINTSARRFETEGFHRRYILMSMMMGLFSIGEEEFFVRAPGLYRVQQETGTLYLSPFFRLIRSLMREVWGWSGTVGTFYRLGHYIRQNSWQMFFFCDVAVRPLLGSGRYPATVFHDKVFARCTNFKFLDAFAGILCFIWFMLILGPCFRIIELKEPIKENLAGR